MLSSPRRDHGWLRAALQALACQFWSQRTGSPEALAIAVEPMKAELSPLHSAPPAAAPKGRLNFLLCCRCCQAFLGIFFFPSMLQVLCSMASIGLAASCGVGTSRLQRPSIRAGPNTRHLILYASSDESGKAWGRRPHLSDGFLARPGSSTGRLHQHQARGLTQHRNAAYASLSAAPSG